MRQPYTSGVNALLPSRVRANTYVMQITLKKVGEYGQLSGAAKTAGRTFIILAIACCLTGGVFTLLSAFQLAHGLDGKTTDQMRDTVANMLRLIGGAQSLMWAAGAFLILSIGCFLYGRRLPPASPHQEHEA